ncbi:hypothetical protein PIB30_111889, partial [Stylosanthes scabra]|nr:hypothetical protein [Stylosanthes scabra]
VLKHPIGPTSSKPMRGKLAQVTFQDQSSTHMRGKHVKVHAYAWKAQSDHKSHLVQPKRELRGIKT